MPGDIHLLIAPGPNLRQCSVLCRATMPERGTWNQALVTCPRCRAPSRSQASQGAMAERELQELIRQACGVQGWLYFHVWNARHSPAGYPDVTAVRAERLVFAELKRVGKVPTVEQQRWIDALQGVKQIETYVWTPADMDAMLAILR